MQKPIYRKETFKEYFNKMLLNPIFIFFILCFIAILIVSKSYTFSFNLTESLPQKLFLIRKNTLPKNRGEYIAFKPKNNRYYKNKTFIKIVGGLPDDLVLNSYNETIYIMQFLENKKQREIGAENKTIEEFFINEYLTLKVKEKSLRGDKLETLKFAGEIPAKNYFVYTSHKDSYDSRYEEIGLIHENEIIGTAIPIF